MPSYKILIENIIAVILTLHLGKLNLRHQQFFEVQRRENQKLSGKVLPFKMFVVTRSVQSW